MRILVDENAGHQAEHVDRPRARTEQTLPTQHPGPLRRRREPEEKNAGQGWSGVAPCPPGHGSAGRREPIGAAGVVGVGSRRLHQSGLHRLVQPKRDRSV